MVLDGNSTTNNGIEKNADIKCATALQPLRDWSAPLPHTYFFPHSAPSAFRPATFQRGKSEGNGERPSGGGLAEKWRRNAEWWGGVTWLGQYRVGGKRTEWLGDGGRVVCQWRARHGSRIDVRAETAGKVTSGTAADSETGGARKPQPEWRGEGKEDAEGRRVAGAERMAEEANRGEGDGERREGKTGAEERGKEGADDWSGDAGNSWGTRARGRGGVNRSSGLWVRDWWAEEWGDDIGFGDESEREEWEGEGWDRGEGESRGEFESDGVGESGNEGQKDVRGGGGRSSSGGRRRELVEGWVEGPDESANLAFSWVNEAGRQEDLISPAAKRYQWVWPMRQQGSSWRMPFARPTSVDIANTRSCAKLLPPSAYSGLSTTITGRNASEDQLRALLATAGAAAAAAGGGGNASALGVAGERWLVFVPRHGLGNSLRGFSSALLFALLSGRRFLRWHGGPHGRVLTRLCDAFECATDQLVTTSLALPLPLLEPHDLVLHGLSDPSPVLSVFTGSFFDKFWRGDKRVYRCVLAAFRCATIWCVHAQTLALLLLNGPSVRLERELDKGLWSIRPLPLVQQQPEEGDGVGLGVGGGRVGMGGEEEEHWEMEKVPPGQAVRMQFDMALHVRGRPSTPLPLLTIFIATDTDEVRPAIVKFLRPFGRVFFSNAPAIHLSKSQSQGSHLGTLGDFLMLSKAAVVVSFTRYISTFAMFAAMLGNGTLVAQPESESNCRFVVEHLAEMPP
ncbi:unnamed protein product [Closterium sp. Yama58-4]|nr:unnamed protein product [Closterium sp. Yama58-4]